MNQKAKDRFDEIQQKFDGLFQLFQKQERSTENILAILSRFLPVPGNQKFIFKQNLNESFPIKIILQGPGDKTITIGVISPKYECFLAIQADKTTAFAVDQLCICMKKLFETSLVNASEIDSVTSEQT